MTPAEALDIAKRLHAGQQDKAGTPYWHHLQRVQARLDQFPIHFQIAAALHDSIEDTNATEGQLVELGVPTEAIRIIKLLTKTDANDYENYLTAIAQDKEAFWVKLADMADNCDVFRLALLPVDQKTRLKNKYKIALDLLLAEGQAHLADRYSFQQSNRHIRPCL